MKFKDYVNESSLSRIWHHVEENKRSFAVISAYRGEYSKKENEERHIKLKSIVREMGYGFIEMKGGYREDKGFVNEKSLFIPSIDKKDAIKIGADFEQESILYKDDKEFVSIDTKNNVGRVIKKFIKSSSKNNINLAKEAIKDFFSELLKGSHRNKKFVFNTLEERTYVGHLSRMSGKKPEWIEIL